MSSQSITELHIRTVANGIQVMMGQEFDITRARGCPPSQIYVFNTIPDLIEWINRQMWQFQAGVEA